MVLDPRARKRDAAFKAQLSPEQRDALRAGRHAEVSAALEGETPALAAWVLEQIWDFEGATRLYERADMPLDRLRCALEWGDAGAIDLAVESLATSGGALAREAAEVLESRRRHADAARLFAAAEDAPAQQAQALVAAGDREAAARAWLDRGEARQALDALGELRPGTEGTLRSWALATEAWWALGDMEACARAAQAGLRAAATDPAPADATVAELRVHLAESLRALGHPVAAQVVLELTDARRHAALEAAQAMVTALGGQGRYRVLAAHPAPLAGSAYVGLDRVTHREVEVHLLLADQLETGGPEPAAIEAVRRFVERATQATASRHAALRPILRAEAADGLLVLPRATGGTLRQRIRPPGLLTAPERARAFVRFLAEGLSHVHRLGFAHGGVLPSLITTDAAGRPQLGPAGSDRLSGLAATRTGGLDELLTLTAPELRRGAEMSPSADVYALGRIWMGLLLGRLDLGGEAFNELESLEPQSLATLRAMIAEDPQARPSALEVARALGRPVRDLRDVRGPAETRLAPGDSGLRLVSALSDGDHVVEVDMRWSSEAIDQLCAYASPWFQTIRRREGRRLWLAPWPEGCRRHQGVEDPVDALDPRALAGLEPAMQRALADALRARPDALVRTPAGEHLLGLDLLLAPSGDGTT